jgi:hypothetical protein
MKKTLFAFTLLLSLLLFATTIFPQTATTSTQTDFNVAPSDYMQTVTFTFTLDSGATLGYLGSSRFQLNEYIRNSNTITNPFTAWYKVNSNGNGAYGDTTACKLILRGYANGGWQSLDTITIATTDSTISGVQKMDLNNWKATDYNWYVTNDNSSCHITYGSITIVAIKPED